MVSSSYENIGSLLYQTWKNTNDPSLKKERWNFIQTYLHTPLFVVGFSDADVDDFRFDRNDYELFKLPFKAILLDLPNAKRNVSNHHEIPAIIYAADLGHEEYYIAVLIDNRKTAVLLDRDYCARLGADYDAVYASTKSTCEYRVWISFKAKLFPHEERFAILKDTHLYGECDVKRQVLLNDLSKPEVFMTCVECQNVNKACENGGKIASLFFDIVVKAVTYINQPFHYVVKETIEISPREKRLIDKSVKPFFFKKPSHIVLDYSQTKELIHRSQSSPHQSSNIIMPHQRRGHPRYLRSDVYKVKRRIWVRPADVNAGLQWRSFGRIYEVIR